MKPPSTTGKSPILCALALIAGAALGPAAFGQQVTFSPYLQLGDNSAFGPADQIVIAWQTDETAPKASAYKVEFQAVERYPRSVTPKARVIDNYLAADPSLPTLAASLRRSEGRLSSEYLLWARPPLGPGKKPLCEAGLSVI